VPSRNRSPTEFLVYFLSAFEAQLRCERPAWQRASVISVRTGAGVTVYQWTVRAIYSVAVMPILLSDANVTAPLGYAVAGELIRLG
jgi:hypothetical protein